MLNGYIARIGMIAYITVAISVPFNLPGGLLRELRVRLRCAWNSLLVKVVVEIAYSISSNNNSL